MSLHTFITQKVDVAIMECGIGGEYDATNVISDPRVCAITSLGIDHQALLGQSLPEIAWHKAGIMKNGVVCVSAPQREDALQVLRERSVERSAVLVEIADETVEALKNGKIVVGLKGAHQYVNAAVAVRVCQEWVEKFGKSGNDEGKSVIGSDDAVKTGLESAQWPGRAQTLKFEEEFGDQVVFYFDGAHTPESLTVCGEWFDTVLKSESGRNSDELLRPLTKVAQPFSHVIFCSNDSNKVVNASNTNFTVAKDKSQKVQLGNKESWERVSKGTQHEFAQVHMFDYVDEALAVAAAKNHGGNKITRVLVTGSMHLIGSVLTRCGAEML
ncbi:Folylpolyglutamate synthetase [Physocladia obscura]|uniref:tetrahydrofolate synthase n=1 Tax=Physocladia obscura TaxID=109957 RepID=A0AAD5T2L9_9FUNG|nr:Folylpolyglutamate synthetase [Physocladia obscura]